MGSVSLPDAAVCALRSAAGVATCLRVKVGGMDGGVVSAGDAASHGCVAVPCLHVRVDGMGGGVDGIGAAAARGCASS